MGGHESLESASAVQLINILQNLIDSHMLKYTYMMMMAGRTFPVFNDAKGFARDFLDPFAAKVGWKISQSFDAELKRRKELAE